MCDCYQGLGMDGVVHDTGQDRTSPSEAERVDDAEGRVVHHLVLVSVAVLPKAVRMTLG